MDLGVLSLEGGICLERMVSNPMGPHFQVPRLARNFALKNLKNTCKNPRFLSILPDIKLQFTVWSPAVTSQGALVGASLPTCTAIPCTFAFPNALGVLHTCGMANRWGKLL